MATGPENYRKAEFHLKAAAAIETDGHDDSMSAWHQRQAQVHATLALAAACATGLNHGYTRGVAWQAAVDPEQDAEVTR